jgi:3-oxoacyl-[acyl-carrier protein] reductase
MQEGYNKNQKKNKMERKRALITGASSGIGRATAIRFASEGYDVCLNGQNEERLNAVFSQLSAGNHLLFSGNYADEAVITKAEKLIREAWGVLDVLVNCAGIFEQVHVVNSTLNEWHKIFDIMLNGAILTTRLASKFMSAGGSMVHVTSIHGTHVESGSSSYAAAKAAINQYCRSAALELADNKIRVNAIAPGYLNTPMAIVNGVNANNTPLFHQKYVKGNLMPLRRAAEPEEIAGVALFLAGKDASYITGQIITVDGGLTITF